MTGPLDPPKTSVLRSLSADIRIIPQHTYLWRVHSITTRNAVPWNGMRTWGPLPDARWDPHPLPEGDHAPEGVAYLAFDVTTCLAEVFQASRFVDVNYGAPYATVFEPQRPLRMLNLSGAWLLRAGATAAVASGPKVRTRRWARAIRDAWPDLDGIVAMSAVIGAKECVALWMPALDAFPARPLASDPLASPALRQRITMAAESIEFGSNC